MQLKLSQLSGNMIQRCSTLHFVDLAGCERHNKTGNEGARLR